MFEPALFKWILSYSVTSWIAFYLTWIHASTMIR